MTVRNAHLGMPIFATLAEYESYVEESEFLLFRQGLKDGESGRPLANLLEVYLHGYMLGQAKAHRRLSS
jgi:hypothetical protein